MTDDLDDIALEKSEEFENIASELFEVDKTGIFLQGVLSFLVAATAALGSNAVTTLSFEAILLIFLVTFLPNFGLKVLAEYIKKRALVRGMKQGYVEGRKDSYISGTNLNQFVRWMKVYKTLNSATLWRSSK